MTQLDGFEVDRAGWGGSGAYTDAVDTLTLHMTQSRGGTLEGARSTLHQKRAESHLLVEPRARIGRRRVQLVDLDRAAKSLANPAGGIQTNRNGTVQVEIIGFSEHPDDLTEDDWLWLGSHVVGPACRAKRIPIECNVTFHVYPPDQEDPPQYLGREPWRVVGLSGPQNVVGIVGHQHWRENTHGDPGALSTAYYRNGTTSPIDLILEGATGAPTTEEFTMDAAAKARFDNIDRKLKQMEDNAAKGRGVGRTVRDAVTNLRSVVDRLAAIAGSAKGWAKAHALAGRTDPEQKAITDQASEFDPTNDRK